MVGFWKESGRAAQLAIVGLAVVIGLFPAVLLSVIPSIERHDIPRDWIYLPVIGLLIGLLIPQVAVVLTLRSQNRRIQVIGTLLAVAGAGIILLGTLLGFANGTTLWPQGLALLTTVMFLTVGVLDLIAAILGIKETGRVLA